MKEITIGEFLNHVNDLIYDNPDLLDMSLNGLYVYMNGWDGDRIEISTNELECQE
jgi:hypothetical protein